MLSVFCSHDFLLGYFGTPSRYYVFPPLFVRDLLILYFKIGHFKPLLMVPNRLIIASCKRFNFNMFHLSKCWYLAHIWAGWLK